VLRREQALAALLPEVFRCDRLVLLGDLIELRQGPVREALSAAEPVLREIGAALGPASEAVIVPGNHDHHLAGEWLARRARDAEPPPLGLESALDWEPGETLATVASWLEPARVRAAYPGVWLRGDVYAIHGHYADRHTTVPMFERLGAGAMARLARDAATGPTHAEDYEAILEPIYAWIHAVAQNRTTAGRHGSDGASSRAWRTLSSDRRRRRSTRRTAPLGTRPGAAPTTVLAPAEAVAAQTPRCYGPGTGTRVSEERTDGPAEDSLRVTRPVDDRLRRRREQGLS
jgi:hypothetical protein